MIAAQPVNVPKAIQLYNSNGQVEEDATEQSCCFFQKFNNLHYLSDP